MSPPLPSGSFRKKENSYLPSGAIKPDAHSPHPTPPHRRHFLSGKEREGRGGTDVLIPQPYNECQWPTESLIVLQDLRAVGGAGSPWV